MDLTEQAFCPHGQPDDGSDCSLCIDEQATADEQATDEDWRDWS